MNEFVASNGYKSRDGGLTWFTKHGVLLTGGMVDYGAHWKAALREFFLAERDAELGRWRSREHPEYVVYARECDAYVLNETHGGGWSRIRGTVGEDVASRVAREFFAAHPEPKPWHDAKPGEVWDVYVDGERFDLTVVNADEFGAEFFGRRVRCSVKYTGITRADRIWPEVSS